MSAHDRSARDRTTHDRATPDRATPDRTTPDRATPDRATPDRTAPDHATRDHTMPDATAPDRADDLGRSDEAELSPSERAALTSGREALRRVREAGREAVREARRAARDSNREARENVLAAARDARRSAREAARAARERAGSPDPETEGDTRTRIQRVGLRLFTEHGYEATSLREIAEQLGVTKAALYYHFKSKDEIIASLVDTRLARVDELIAWGESQPRGVATRRELLRRYSDMVYEHDHQLLIRFFDRNQSSMAQHPAGARMRDQIYELLQLFIEKDAPLTDQIRSSMALFALHSVWFTMRDPEISEEERNEAALSVALELVE